MASVPEVESEINLTTDLQEVSLAAGSSVFLSCFFFLKGLMSMQVHLPKKGQVSLQR